MPLIPALRRQRQADLCEFEASLVCRVNSRTANAVVHRNPVARKMCVCVVFSWRRQQHEAILHRREPEKHQAKSQPRDKSNLKTVFDRSEI